MYVKCQALCLLHDKDSIVWIQWKKSGFKNTYGIQTGIKKTYRDICVCLHYAYVIYIIDTVLGYRWIRLASLLDASHPIMPGLHKFLYNGKWQ